MSRVVAIGGTRLCLLPHVLFPFLNWISHY